MVINVDRTLPKTLKSLKFPRRVPLARRRPNRPRDMALVSGLLDASLGRDYRTLAAFPDAGFRKELLQVFRAPECLVGAMNSLELNYI